MIIESIITNPYIGTSIVSLSFKKFFRFSSNALLIILVFSIFNLIKFSSTTLTTKIAGIEINIPYLVLFIILFYKRKSHLENWISKDTEEEYPNKVDFFKVQFKNLSDKELENKLNDEKMTEDAKTALKELKKERNKISTTANSGLAQ